MRPDITLVSESTKNIIIMELTVPWEDRLGEAHERKMTKYEQLVTDCRAQGWKARCMPIEVGWICGALPPQSVYCAGHCRNNKEQGHQEHHRRSRESLEMALDP